MKKRSPTMREMLAMLREQDRVIEALVELCEEHREHIEQLTRTAEATPADGLNGWRH